MKLHRIYKNLLKESNEINGKHLVVVDIQPEYQDAFYNMSNELAEFINNNYNGLYNLTFLYNGADTLGMINEDDYRFWWIEQGLNEEIVYNSNFYDKGYAFFRNCMDAGSDEEDIVNLIKFMIKHNINDTRDITKEFWIAFVKEYGSKDIRDLMEMSDDCLYIPELMDELNNYSNIILCGGGINECLKEVEIALDALGKSYQTYSRFTY